MAAVPAGVGDHDRTADSGAQRVRERLVVIISAVGVADSLTDLGRRVLEDVAVVGYDNWEEFAADCRPPLTTVTWSGWARRRPGCCSTRWTGSGPAVWHPCRLVVRESTAPATPPAAGPGRG